MDAMNGCNSTVMAYGQSGTGKTYTIGLESTSCSDETTGIIPRAVSDIFEQAARAKKEEVKVSVSFFEVYQERLYDLCQNESGKKGKRRTLEVREDESGQVVVPGLTCLPVASSRDLMSIINKGNKNRKIRQTERNSSSSRSHAIVQVLIEQRSRKGDLRTTKSKISFVDLAGSERWNKEVDMGEERVNEMCTINTSLGTLSAVVSALSDGNRKHIPYRSSLLTFILRDSLGGNCLLSLIVTLSPSSDCFHESVSTLRFATRASSLPNHPVVNVSNDVHTLLDYKEREIKRLRGLLADLTSPSDTNRNQAAAAALKEMQDLSSQDETSSLAQELEDAKRALASERLLRQDLERELQRQQHRPHSEATYESRGGGGMPRYHLSGLTPPSTSSRGSDSSWRSPYDSYRANPVQQPQRRNGGVSKVSKIEEAIMAIRARINALSVSSPSSPKKSAKSPSSPHFDHDRRQHQPLSTPRAPPIEEPSPRESAADASKESTPSSFGRLSLVSASASPTATVSGGWGRSALLTSSRSEETDDSRPGSSSQPVRQTLFGRSSLALTPSMPRDVSGRPVSRGSSARLPREGSRPVSGSRLGPATMIYILGSSHSSQKATKIANCLKVDAEKLSKKGSLFEAIG